MWLNKKVGVPLERKYRSKCLAAASAERRSPVSPQGSGITVTVRTEGPHKAWPEILYLVCCGTRKSEVTYWIGSWFTVVLRSQLLIVIRRPDLNLARFTELSA